jgi:hypothetical protein
MPVRVRGANHGNPQIAGIPGRHVLRKSPGSVWGRPRLTTQARRRLKLRLWRSRLMPGVRSLQRARASHRAWGAANSSHREASERLEVVSTRARQGRRAGISLTQQSLSHGERRRSAGASCRLSLVVHLEQRPGPIRAAGDGPHRLELRRPTGARAHPRFARWRGGYVPPRTRPAKSTDVAPRRAAHEASQARRSNACPL